MLARFCPRLHVTSIHGIDLSRLAAAGVKGIILDIDNTIAEWGSKDVPDAVLVWLDDARTHGFRLCMLSNSRRHRIDAVSRALGIPAAQGLKPFSAAFISALKVLGTSPEETALIGDQVLTDVFGGNRAGLYTILVQPMSGTEFFTTRIARSIERIILRRLAGRGMLCPADQAGHGSKWGQGDRRNPKRQG